MLHAKINRDDALRASDDRRAGTDRTPIGQPSTVRADDTGPLDVIVENLSSGGFQFRSNDRVAIGRMVYVGLAGGGMAQARVVRVDDTRHGCEFVRPLSDDQLRLAFRTDTVVAGAFPAVATMPMVTFRENKLPGAARLLILATGGIVSWAAVLQIGTILFR